VAVAAIEANRPHELEKGIQTRQDDTQRLAQRFSCRPSTSLSSFIATVNPELVSSSTPPRPRTETYPATTSGLPEPPYGGGNISTTF
jgi:hypothetical protein